MYDLCFEVRVIRFMKGWKSEATGAGRDHLVRDLGWCLGLILGQKRSPDGFEVGEGPIRRKRSCSSLEEEGI